MNFSTQKKKETNMQHFQRAIEVVWIDTAGDEDGQKRNRSELEEFIESAKTGDVETINRLLERGNESAKTLLLSNFKGNTALTMAAIYGDLDVIQVLLGANGSEYAHDQLIARNAMSQTALIVAASNGRDGAIQALLGVNEGKYAHEQLIARTPSGANALMYAASNGDPFVVQSLLRAKGGDYAHEQLIARTNEYGLTALMEAVIHGTSQAVQALLGVNEGKYAHEQLIARNEYGLTAFMHAMNRKSVDIIQAILGAKGGDYAHEQLIACDKDGYTALMRAVLYGHIDKVKILLSLSQRLVQAQVSKQGNAGQNALMLAVDKKSSMVRQLLQVDDESNKRQLLCTDRDGTNALIIALLNENGLADIIVHRIIALSVFGPFFASSVIERRRDKTYLDYRSIVHRRAVKLLIRTALYVMIPFIPTVDAQNQLQLTDGQKPFVNVSARSMASNYWCDVLQYAKDDDLSVDGAEALFKNTLLEVTETEFDSEYQKVIDEINRQSLEYFKNTYHGMTYKEVYGDYAYHAMLDTTATEDAPSRDSYIRAKEADPLVKARIDRFLNRKLPADSPQVLDIERRIERFSLRNEPNNSARVLDVERTIRRLRR